MKFKIERREKREVTKLKNLLSSSTKNYNINSKYTIKITSVMMSASGTTSTSPDDKTSSFPPQHDTQKSLTIISLTGFAGSLVGLSISRSRTRSALALGSQIHGAGAHAANLPIVFAISTATFASIIEYSYMLSPTRVLMSILKDQGLIASTSTDVDASLDKDQQQWWDEGCTTTVGDYAIGGAIAGALFTGGSSGIVEKTLSNALQAPQGDVKNMKTNITFSSGTDKQKSMIGRGKVVTLASKKKGRKVKKGVNRIPIMKSTSGKSIPKPNANAKKMGTVPLPRPKIMSGLTTGLLLGLAAGIAQISLTKLEQFLQSQTNVDVDADADTDFVVADGVGGNRNKTPVWSQQQEEELDTKVNNMSTEEIQREINALKKRFQ